MRWFVVLVIVVPLVELFLLLQIDRVVGFWPTIGLTIVTGFLGGSLAKREGLKVWRSWRQAMSELRPPEQGVVDGVLVLLGGALLITPGVLTDMTGFFLLIPFTRRIIARRVRAAIDRRLEAGELRVVNFASGFDGADFDGYPQGSGVGVVETEGVGRDEQPEQLPGRADD
ncbi:MAG: FxsA family protein [Polyangiaceae bacterium]